MANRFTKQPLSDWMQSTGPDSDIVISSRIRLARNLQAFPFPMLATHLQSKEILDRMAEIAQSAELKKLGDFEFIPLANLNDLEKRVLVEKHLISPHLAKEVRNAAVILSENEALSVMINEEDHLRIQCIYPGLQVHKSWELANVVDDIFENYVDYAFDQRRGYLTSCPTNTGTGLRASVMMHLPALVMTQQINRILPAITQVGLAVRGIYGEGSEAVGNLFQISNQITLGQTELEIIDNLNGVAKQMIEHEKAARNKLSTESKIRLMDRVNRSLGILSQAAIMDSKEGAQRLSDVRLGIDLGIISNISVQTINELLIMTQPGFLQMYYGEKLSPEERDIRRAQLIREKLKKS